MRIPRQERLTPRAALFLLLLAPLRLTTAQRVTPTFEVGAAAMRFADSLANSGASFTPGLTIEWPRAKMSGLGTYTQLTGGAWSTQGSLDLSLFTPALHLVSGEVVASTAGTARWDATRTAQSLAIGRAHIDATHAGLWVGGGVGAAWDGFSLRQMQLGDAGVWARAGRVTISAITSPTVLGDSLRYADTELAARWSTAAIDLLASAGARAGDRPTTFGSNARSWASASITLHVTPLVGVVLGAGTYPVDLAQGFPGGRYLTLNLRVAPAPARRDDGRHELLELPQRPLSPIEAFDLSRAPNGARVLRVHAPSIRSLEISGDFSGWMPVALAPSGDGWWVAMLSLRPGTHQIAIRVNGGAWEVPPGLVPVRDEFGGMTGLWIVH